MGRQVSSSIDQHSASMPAAQKGERKQSGCKGTPAEKTGWELSVWVCCCCLGSFPIFSLSSSVSGRQVSQGNVTSSGMSRHRPRQVHRIQPLRLKWGTFHPRCHVHNVLTGVRQDPELMRRKRFLILFISVFRSPSFSPKLLCSGFNFILCLDFSGRRFLCGRWPW